MVGFGKKPEQGGFGQIISRRMKNRKRIMVAARKIVDRTCECPALCTAFSLDPVSYTHLDVYKRQVLANSIHVFAGKVKEKKRMNSKMK